jgi:hypothetical protein
MCFALEKHDISYHGSKRVSNNIMKKLYLPWRAIKQKVRPHRVCGLAIGHKCNGLNLKLLGERDKTSCVML